MFGIGMTELLVIMAVALIVFGPKRLPELARSMGRALGEFRHASNDLRQTLSETPPTPGTPPADPKRPAVATPTTPPATRAAAGAAVAAESGDAASSAEARETAHRDPDDADPSSA